MGTGAVPFVCSGRAFLPAGTHAAEAVEAAAVAEGTLELLQRQGLRAVKCLTRKPGAVQLTLQESSLAIENDEMQVKCMSTLRCYACNRSTH